MSGRNATGSGGQDEYLVRPDPGRGVDTPISGGVADSAPSGPMLRDPVFLAIALLALVSAVVAVWWASGVGDTTLSSRAVGVASLPGAEFRFDVRNIDGRHSELLLRSSAVGVTL